METMRTYLSAATLAAAMLVGLPIAAQTPTPPAESKLTEQQRKDVERQLKDAEKQMRDAERQMRQAEQAMRDASRKVEEVARDRARAMVQRRVVVFGDHARLGIVLHHERNPRTETVGALIEALTPGSPAEEAGLEAGDVVTKFDGQSLTAGNVDADEDESAPAARMLDLAKSLTDGQKVTLEIRRDNATKTVTVTARKAVGPHVRVITGWPDETPEVPDFELPEIPDVPDIDVNVMVGHHWLDIDLVALTPDLGEYFGTSGGLLVVHAPKDDALKLKAGDVILKIGDRTPETPSKAMRILHSYEGGETVPVQILRKREKLTVSLQVPKSRAQHIHRTPAAPAAPAAPAVPAAPAAPAPVPPGV
jgi:S1-C subfamily serine protease